MLGIRGARTTDIVRVAASTGHHAVLVDLEHSTMSLDVAAAICSAAHDLGLVPFVRTPEREYGAIGRLLDGGAEGIVAPRIETAEEAATVVGACRFPPRGQRSQLASVPSLGMKPTPAKTLNPLARRGHAGADPGRDAAQASPTPTRSPLSTASTWSRSAPTT